MLLPVENSQQSILSVVRREEEGERKASYGVLLGTNKLRSTVLFVEKSMKLNNTASGHVSTQLLVMYIIRELIQL